MNFPRPLPDDPRKWDGWNRYNSPDLYERLCLDPQTNPSNELIEEHFRELLLWWQKKLPLKNQPSNPLAQLLRSGLEESSRYLTEARVELLNPEKRQKMDEQLAAQAEERAVAEFQKYLTFALNDKRLLPHEEETLQQFGRDNALSEERIRDLIDAELAATGAIRVLPPTPEEIAAGDRKPGSKLNPQEDFMRMLRLSGLDSDDMTDDQRDAFINVAENLGLEPGDAEDMVDLYLEQFDGGGAESAEPATVMVKEPPKVVATVVAVAPVVAPVIDTTQERVRFQPFKSSIGLELLLIPSGTFQMGSEESDAAPNEAPVSSVTLTRFFLSRHPVTNAQYEQFERDHARKRATGAGDQHPVVYVNNSDAMKFCQWLSTRERRRYRLPTEAEWEYAARGTEGRKYPWGVQEGRGDLANFADRNTLFAWSDREIDDGYPESSPVGAFPLGASPFGIEDMAGNVWEWCSDFFEPYRLNAKTNPRGAKSGTKRVYRGGSWKSRFNSLRASARGSNVLSYSCNDLGFRVVCECD